MTISVPVDVTQQCFSIDIHWIRINSTGFCYLWQHKKEWLKTYLLMLKTYIPEQTSTKLLQVGDHLYSFQVITSKVGTSRVKPSVETHIHWICKITFAMISLRARHWFCFLFSVRFKIYDNYCNQSLFLPS